MNNLFKMNSRVLNFLFLISVSSIFLTNYYEVRYFRAASILFGVACLCWLIKQLSQVVWLVFLLLGSPLFLFSLLNSIHTEGVSVVVFLVLICQLAIAFYFVKNVENSGFVSFFFFSFLIFSIYKIVIFDYGPEEFNNFFSGIGRNGYSAILFSLLIGYCIRQVLADKAVSIIAVALTFLVMIPLYGRSSIIATGIVLLATIFKRSSRRAFIYGSILLAVIIFLIGYQDFNFFGLIEVTNFRSGVESDRWDVINQWVDRLGVFEFLMGYDLASLDAVIILDGNPHNSFIRLHSFFGVGILVLFLVLLVSMFYIILDKQYFLLCLFVSILFKCFFDIIYFVGDQDFLLYPILFYVFFRSDFSKHEGIRFRHKEAAV